MKQHLKRTWVIIRTAWMRNLNYRFTIVAYRVGEIAEVLVLVLLWTAIYTGGSGTIKGFTLEEMITYVLVGTLFSVVTRNFVASTVSRHIEAGELSMYLVRPISYINFILINEVGRTFLATIMSVLSQVVVIVFFLNKIILNTDIRYIGTIVVMLVLAFMIELLISFLIGTVAFWTDETEGIHATADRIKRFFSGGYFPLSLLPSSLVAVSVYLPFGYSFFVPAQLYLKKIDLKQGWTGIAIQLVWILLLSGIIYVVWNRGLKRYEATGS